MVHSTIGLLHLSAALLAMATGAIVLLSTKGGLLHKRIGYVYVVCMLILNLTAFLIYHLFGKFGVFHWLAALSLLGLAGGMIPVLLRNRISKWIYWHYHFMNWSIVGLYAAFWAETLTRTLPMNQFWPVVLVATTLTSVIGSYLIRRNTSRLLAENA